MRKVLQLWPVLVLCATVGGAQDFSLVSKLLEGEKTKNKIPGYAAAVYYRGNLLWARGSGFADLKTKRPVRRDTPFRLASISKPISAVALLYLFEQRKIQLKDDVRKYCPAFPQKPFPSTLEQLLGHTGGIRHYRGQDDADNETAYTGVVDSLKKFAMEPLAYEPGTRYLYTTYGYSLVGCALVGAGGMSFEKWLEDKVFATVGMYHSGLDNGRGVSARRAQGYRRTADGDVEDCAYSDNSAKYPGGGMVSTVDDLARFVDGLYREQLLRRETVDLMWTSGKTKAGKITGYGLGWSLGKAPEGDREIYHTGSQQGTSTLLYLRPQERFAFVWLTNMESLPARLPVAREVYRLVHGK
jgi:CubicO group peptidase (beta-lactamase class C family)